MPIDDLEFGRFQGTTVARLDALDAKIEATGKAIDERLDRQGEWLKGISERLDGYDANHNGRWSQAKPLVGGAVSAGGLYALLELVPRLLEMLK